MKRYLLVPILCAAAASSALGAVTVLPQADGIHVTSDSTMMSFVLNYPALMAPKKSYKLTSANVDNPKAVVLKYEGGGELDLSFDTSGAMVVSESNLPADVQKIEFRMNMPLTWSAGGTWQTGTDAPKPFPAEKALQPHMYQGGAPTLTFRDGDGKGVKITIEQYSYQEVNDQRPWGTNSFAWMTSADAKSALTYRFEDAPAAPASSGGATTNAAPNP